MRASLSSVHSDEAGGGAQGGVRVAYGDGGPILHLVRGGVRRQRLRALLERSPGWDMANTHHARPGAPAGRQPQGMPKDATAGSPQSQPQVEGSCVSAPV
jgi:hypothetical protein